ncbi:MAG TPA: AAA family ATPase [Halomicronema sp.]
MATTASSNFPNIPGYTILEQLYAGSRTIVYRGRQEAQQLSVVIKILRQAYPSFNELVQFRNQYTITKNLNIPGIVPPLNLENYQNGYALVMEDGGSVSIEQYVQHKSLTLINILEIGLQMAEILHHLHARRVIHKDIKPANILIHPETQEIKLIDFSIASLLPKETQEIQNPNVLEGTLAYLAPEQTGRMNRAIDYRADFYSLGVTLYQLLTGELPFSSNEPLEVIHGHIAKLPIPPHQLKETIPCVVSSIVLKLMEKNAEDRYQSALGLKYDLQKCLKQWQETATITEFKLGQKDKTDRFLIPEKLYGREKEVQTLLDAFDRLVSLKDNFVANSPETSLNHERNKGVELMLVAGFSGIGKTAVVNEIHKPIVEKRGYFIKGKFDQFNRNIPLSGFVQSLRDLISQLFSESDLQLALWRENILAAVGENGQVLIDVIPELELIIGKQPPATELSGTAAQNRFNLLFQKFIEVFTTPEHPLVLFLDDLQWADSASLQLIKLLMEDKKHLLLLGAYRDNEVHAAHPFILTVEELKKAGKTINKTTLAPLTFRNTNQLLADTLHCSTERALPLTELINRKTQGNPFFITQFLKALHGEGYIKFDRNKGYWECDISQINSLSLTDDIVEFMAQQLQKCNRKTQRVLQLAACIGNQFNLATLAIVSEQSEISAASALWQALQEGLILPQSEVYKFYLNADEEDKNPDKIKNVQYRFLHDRVQQAAYSLIPDNEKQATHYKIGKLLLDNSSNSEREERLFEITTHLNAGRNLINQDSEKEQLAELNLKAGCKALASTAYAAAVQYLKTGIDFLSTISTNSWQDQYELTLALYSAAAEAEYLNINFSSATALAEIALQHTKTLLDRVKVYELQMQICIAQLEMVKAVEIGLNVLEQLGVHLLILEQENSLLIPLPALDELDNLPSMKNANMLAAMQIMKMLGAPVFMAKPEIFPQLIITMVSLCLEHGNSGLSAFAYGFYGLLLSGMGNLDEGYHAGKIALKLLEKFEAKDLKAKVYNLFNSNIRTWKEHSINSVIPLQEAVQSGLETGDIEWGGYSAANLCSYLFFTEDNLETAVEKQSDYVDLSIKIKQEIPIHFSQVWRQLGLNFQGRVVYPEKLVGESFNELELLPRLISAKSGTVLYIFYVAKTILLYHLGKYSEASQQVLLAKEWAGAAFGFMQVAILNFYHSLALLAQLDNPNDDAFKEIWPQIEDNQKMLEFWAKYAPMNHQHKVALIEAEKCRIFGHKTKAIELYEQAILGAKDNGYIREEALANELAAKFYLAWGKNKISAGYMQEAYYCYARWGAGTKTKDLEHSYPDLLNPILQESAATFNPFTTLASLGAPLSIHSSTSTNCSSSSSINFALDFGAILKASQAISGTIQLDELLQKLTQIILQNSGGDRCALILPNYPQGWQIVAIATTETIKLTSEPMEGSINVPVKLIQYIKNTNQVVSVEDLKTDLLIIDEYLNKYQPKSILGLPILNQGNLLGILYLENQSTTGVFTNERILVLNFLCTQAAISLENARLYQQAQHYSQQLEQSQLKLIHSEKMSALGNLVAGVAHEINNPIGFIYGNINQAISSVQDITKHLKLYQEKFPNPGSEIDDHAEEIEIDYQLEDLPKMLTSMQVGCDRIKGISTSLRSFSRADKDYKVPFNIHEGIDSTLLILKHRLKAQDHRPAIEVVKNYGEFSNIECFPGQLNQVFMNILANAIDVFDEEVQQSSKRDFKTNPQKITIKTAFLPQENSVEIIIQDNGKGMSEEVKTKIFEYLFTTKGVGKGTGLGLAIARQIIVEKHGGSLEVESKLGEETTFLLRLPAL